jgi:hypothetical protein
MTLKILQLDINEKKLQLRDLEMGEAKSLPEVSPTQSSTTPKSGRKGLYIGIFLIVIFGLVIIYFFSPRDGTPGITPTKPIHHIDYFLVSEKGTEAQVQFALMSQDLDFVSTDGTVRITITDSSTGQKLYDNSFALQKNDFNYYQTRLGETILAYQWSIPLSSVQKCVSYATATLTFTSVDGKSCSETQEYVSLPQYTTEELKQLYENKYLQTATDVGKTVTKTNFRITLVRMGPFTHLQYDTFGDEVTQFRVDFEVKALTQEPEYLFESNIVIVDNLGNQYNYEYGGTLDLGEIYPGVTKKGYVLFPAINENAENLRITVLENDYPEDIIYEFNVSI